MQEHWYNPSVALMFVKLWRTFCSSFEVGFACDGEQNGTFSLCGQSALTGVQMIRRGVQTGLSALTDWQACLSWANHVTCEGGAGQHVSSPHVMCMSVQPVSSISFLVLPAVSCGPVLLVPTMHDRQLILCLCSLTGLTLLYCKWCASISNWVYHLFPFSFGTMGS